MKIYDLRLDANNDIVYSAATSSVVKFNTIVLSTTVNNLQSLVNTSQLEINRVYQITDSYHGGYIYVKSLSNNSVEAEAIWSKDFTCKAYGAITIDSATAGSVDTLTVDGVNQLTSSIPFTTDIRTTAAAVATNINANNSALYRAVQCDTTIVMVAKNGGTSSNGKVVSGTSTTLNLILPYNTKYGQDAIRKNINVLYNLSQDRFYRAQDDRNNILDVYLLTSDTVDTYNEFRWTDVRNFSENIISYKLHYDIYLYGDAAILTTCRFFGLAYAQRIFLAGSTTTAMSGIDANIGSSITGFSYMSSSSSANFSSIVMTQLGSITNITLKGSGASTTFSQFSLIGTFATMTNFDIKGQFIFQYLMLSGYFTSVKNLTSTGGAISFTRNTLNGYSTNITNLSNTGTATFGIQSCFISGAFSAIGPVMWTTTGGTNYILGCNLSGFTSTLSGTASGSSVTVQNINLVGANTVFGFNSATQSTVVFNNINISVGSGNLGGISATSDFKTISNIDWSEQGYSLSYTTPTLNNTTNRGLSGSQITLGYVPAKWYPSIVEIEGLSLASASGNLKIGIDVDNDSSFLAATFSTSLNSIITTPLITKTKATALRKIVATPLVAGITAGSFRVILNGKIGL